MIKYTPFWETLEKKGISQYTLINKHKINNRTINYLKHNKHMSTHTLNKLCEILNCRIEDIMVFQGKNDDCTLEDKTD